MPSKTTDAHAQEGAWDSAGGDGDQKIHSHPNDAVRLVRPVATPNASTTCHTKERYDVTRLPVSAPGKRDCRAGVTR